MNPYCPHLKFMYNCSFFTPPASGVITPKQVLPCAEWVEVITDGVVFFEWEGKLREFRKGTIFWHKAGDWTVWQTTREEPYSCGVFLFDTDGAPPVPPRVSQWASAISSRDFIVDASQAFHRQTVNPEILASYVYNTLLRASSPVIPSQFPPQLEELLAMIDESPGGFVPVSELAAKINSSESFVFTLFRKYLKCPPHRYMLKQQLAKARILLTGKRYSIKEIALLCGFESLEVFYRRFREASGMAPGEYRKRYLSR